MGCVCLQSCSTDLGYGELVGRFSSGCTTTEVSKVGHKKSPISYLVYVNNNRDVVCGYKDSLVPAKMLEAFLGQENCLQFQKIDVKFAF